MDEIEPALVLPWDETDAATVEVVEVDEMDEALEIWRVSGANCCKRRARQCRSRARHRQNTLQRQRRAPEERRIVRG